MWKKLPRISNPQFGFSADDQSNSDYSNCKNQIVNNKALKNPYQTNHFSYKPKHSGLQNLLEFRNNDQYLGPSDQYIQMLE